MPTQTTTTAPWQPQQPFLRRQLSRTEAAYPRLGRTAGLTDIQQQAISGIQNYAQQGSPVVDAANQYTMDVLGGNFLQGPAFQESLSAALDPVQSRVNSQFAGAGRYGSGMHSDTLASAMGDTAAGLYNAERQRQQQAARLAPQLQQSQYRDFSNMLQAGEIQRAAQQDQLNEPYRRLQQYGSLIGGDYGGTSTRPYYENETGQTIGNVAAGIGAAGQALGALDTAWDVGSGIWDAASGWFGGGGGVTDDALSLTGDLAGVGTSWLGGF